MTDREKIITLLVIKLAQIPAAEAHKIVEEFFTERGQNELIAMAANIADRIRAERTQTA